jgi:hypothetical protein
MHRQEHMPVLRDKEEVTIHLDTTLRVLKYTLSFPSTFSALNFAAI